MSLCCWSPATWAGTPPGGAFDLAVDQRPALVALPLDERDVVAAVRRARVRRPARRRRSAAATAPPASARSTTRCCCGPTRWRAWRSTRGRTAHASGRAPAGPTSSDRASFLGLAPAGGFSRGARRRRPRARRRHGLARPPARARRAQRHGRRGRDRRRRDRPRRPRPGLLQALHGGGVITALELAAAPRRRSLRRRAVLLLRPRVRGHARVARVDRRRRPPRSPRSRG